MHKITTRFLCHVKKPFSKIVKNKHLTFFIHKTIIKYHNFCINKLLFFLILNGVQRSPVRNCGNWFINMAEKCNGVK